MADPQPVALIVDDEIQIRRFLRAGFELNGFNIHEAATGADAVRELTLRPHDVIVLDLGLPDMDGAEVIRRIRPWSDVPVLVLSVRSNEDEKVRLLELGADDYIVKPFGMAELMARARAALRRHYRVRSHDPVLTLGPLSIDLSTQMVALKGRRVVLTPKEYRMLQVLAQHAGKVVTHQHLLREVWGATHVNDQHYLRILIRKLRQKIEADPTRPEILLTELGVGYRLAAPSPEPAAEPAPPG